MTPINDSPEHFPIFSSLPDITAKLTDGDALILQAETGAGKTTVLPWHLVKNRIFSGKILMLEPRRIAARTATERIADLLGEKPGDSVGLRTRHDSIPGKCLEIITEGVLTRILRNDPGLEGTSLVIFDEFHERNTAGDIALALTWECRKLFRPDLKILLMSATLSGDEFRKSYGETPYIKVPGRAFPVKTEYSPPYAGEWLEAGMARLTGEALEKIGKESGDVLVFLPGFREIRRTEEAIRQVLPDIPVEILHGKLPPESQRRLFNRPETIRHRIILATNVAETSITLPGIRAVADSGLERRVRYSPRTGLDHWETLPVSLASAEQRKGRAGRLGPGICLRYWKESDFRDPERSPEILETDLAPLLLDILAWGASGPFELTWLTKPPEAGISRAFELLRTLGLIDRDNRLTDEGRKAAEIPFHPRLASMLASAKKSGKTATAAALAAMIEEDIYPAGHAEADLREQLAVLKKTFVNPEMVRKIKDECLRIYRSSGLKESAFRLEEIDPLEAGCVLLYAYPDRAAIRTKRDGIKARYQLAGGRGAVLDGHLSSEEFLVAVDLDGGDADGRIFYAAPFDQNDLEYYADLAGVSSEVVARTEGQHFREKLLFTHRGLSGPAILQISSYWNRGDAIKIDLKGFSPQFYRDVASGELGQGDLDIQPALQQAHVVENGAEAREKVAELLPAGAEVFTSSSVTLLASGISEDINESGRYDSVRAKLAKMDFKMQGREMNKLGATPEYVVGSVHALTETGATITASGSGSQLASYASAAAKVIWVVGSQKIVPDIETGMKRLEEYSLPLEDARMMQVRGMHSSINKVLVVTKEMVPGRITVVIVKEKLGF